MQFQFHRILVEEGLLKSGVVHLDSIKTVIYLPPNPRKEKDALRDSESYLRPYIYFWGEPFGTRVSRFPRKYIYPSKAVIDY